MTGTTNRMIKKIAAVALCATYLSSCTTTDPYTGQQKTSTMAGGAAIGAGLGALGGLVVGGGNTGRNAPIGAANRGLAGGSNGQHMAQLAYELPHPFQGTGIPV